MPKMRPRIPKIKKRKIREKIIQSNQKPTRKESTQKTTQPFWKTQRKGRHFSDALRDRFILIYYSQTTFNCDKYAHHVVMYAFSCLPPEFSYI